MAYRIKCRECGSCMSPIWKGTDRYMYCGFCHQYYAGMSNNLEKVESPFTVNLSNKVEDPIEEENESKTK